MKESERARCLSSIREVNCVYCVQTSSPGCYSLGKVMVKFFPTHSRKFDGNGKTGHG